NLSHPLLDRWMLNRHLLVSSRSGPACAGSAWPARCHGGPIVLPEPVDAGPARAHLWEDTGRERGCGRGTSPVAHRTSRTAIPLTGDRAAAIDGGSVSVRSRAITCAAVIILLAAIF